MPKEYYPEETARYDLRAEEAGSKAKVLRARNGYTHNIEEASQITYHPAIINRGNIATIESS